MKEIFDSNKMKQNKIILGLPPIIQDVHNVLC